ACRFVSHQLHRGRPWPCFHKAIARIHARCFVAGLRECAGLSVVNSAAAIHGLVSAKAIARVHARCFVVGLRECAGLSVVNSTAAIHGLVSTKAASNGGFLRDFLEISRVCTPRANAMLETDLRLNPERSLTRSKARFCLKQTNCRRTKSFVFNDLAFTSQEGPETQSEVRLSH